MTYMLNDIDQQALGFLVLKLLTSNRKFIK